MFRYKVPYKVAQWSPKDKDYYKLRKINNSVQNLTRRDDRNHTEEIMPTKTKEVSENG